MSITLSAVFCVIRIATIKVCVRFPFGSNHIVWTLLLLLIPFKDLLTHSTVRHHAAKRLCADWLWASAALWVCCQQEVPTALPIGAENGLSPTLVTAFLSNAHRDSAARCFTQAGSAAHIPFPTAGAEQGLSCLTQPNVLGFLKQGKWENEHFRSRWRPLLVV